MGSVGSEAGALSCGGTVSGTCNISMNTIALTTTAMSGGRKSTGCPRIAAAQVRAVVRTRSAAMASRHRRRRKGRPLAHACAAADPHERGSPLGRRQPRQQVDDGATAVTLGGYV